MSHNPATVERDLVDFTHEPNFLPRGVDMSPLAIHKRLRDGDDDVRAMICGGRFARHSKLKAAIGRETR